MPTTEEFRYWTQGARIPDLKLLKDGSFSDVQEKPRPEASRLIVHVIRGGKSEVDRVVPQTAIFLDGDTILFAVNYIGAPREGPAPTGALVVALLVPSEVLTQVRYTRLTVSYFDEDPVTGKETYAPPQQTWTVDLSLP